MAQVSISAGKTISPQQMAAQWKHLPHRFQVNLWNFEVKVGKAAQSIFKQSFDMKRFNSSNSTPWRSRSPKSKATHPLMVETGSLRGSIKWKHMSGKDKPSGVTIFTDPKGFAHAKRHKGFCYAAVHNSPDKAHMRRGNVANMPQRQFIGHSSVLDDELKKLSVMIFQGFPK